MTKFSFPGRNCATYQVCESDSQVPIQFQDEGIDLGTDGTIRIINFVGAAVEAVRSGNVLTITITGGGSGNNSALQDHPIASGVPSLYGGNPIVAGNRFFLTGSPGTILTVSVFEGTTMEAKVDNPGNTKANWYFNSAGE